MPGLAGVLSDRLRVPVTQAHAVERLDVAAGAFDGLNVDEVSPLLMLPVGLALRTWHDDVAIMININLRPGAKRQAPKGDPFAGLRERFRSMRTGSRIRAW